LAQFLDYGVLALASFKRKELSDDVVTIEFQEDDLDYLEDSPERFQEDDLDDLEDWPKSLFVYHICSLQEEFKEYMVIKLIGKSVYLNKILKPSPDQKIAGGLNFTQAK
jgi:hypothetical protein